MRSALFAFALLLTACSDTPATATDTPAPVRDNYAAFGDVLAHHQRMSERVARISRALRVANAPLCTVTRPDAGLSTHSLSDYPPELRPLALHFMDLGEEGRYVRSVVPGSPGDVADVRKGERIVSGYPVTDRAPLVLDAGDGPFPVALEAEDACHIPTFVINSDQPNAGTDGREIDLSSALITQVGDDSALAFIIAHEMAHVLRGHDTESPSWEIEMQADADALLLMRNAGFDVAGTVAGWEAGVEAHRASQAVSTTHPPIDIRLKNLEAALARLNRSDTAFLPLSD